MERRPDVAGRHLAKGFLDGRTMIVGGGFNNKLVLYPIAPGKARQQLINWVVTYRMGDGSTRRRGARTGTGTARSTS